MRICRLAVAAAGLGLVVLAGPTGAASSNLTGGGTVRSPVLFPLSGGVAPVDMISHQVLIELFPGRALIRHRILLFNPNERASHVEMGLPRTGSFKHPMVSRVALDTLRNLEVRLEGRPVLIFQEADTFAASRIRQAIPESYRDSVWSWYRWRSECPALAERQIQISYEVQTGPAKLSRGINTRQGFFLAALLEQPRGWGGPLDSLLVELRLNGGLGFSDFFGLYPDHFVRIGEGRACFKLSGRSPGYYDNLLMGIRTIPEGNSLSAPQPEGQSVSCPSQGEKLPAGDFDVFPVKEYLALGVLAASLALSAGLVFYLNSRS